MSPSKVLSIARPLGVLTFLLLLSPGTASAQGCTLTVWPAADLSGHGNPYVHAATEEDCPDYSTQTEVWIGGATYIDCDEGNNAGTVCFHFSNGPASAAAGGIYGWGTWAGFSRHFSITPSGSWHQLGGTRSVTLNAGQPHQEEECEEWAVWNEETGNCVAQNTPILIPLTRGQSIKLTSADRGVLFDMNADGLLDWTAWTEGNSKVAFLAIDRNGNGLIDDGSELFGDHTIDGARNGFAALQAMNMELNGGVLRASINADEPLFERLLLWEDSNHNGISESYEIRPAAPLLSDIGLGYTEHKRRDGHGNLFKWRGWASVRTGPGRNQAIERSQQKARQIDIYDVYFVTKR